MNMGTHIMFSWTLLRKQLLLSYIQLLQSCADVRGLGLQRPVVLTQRCHSNRLHTVMSLNLQPPALHSEKKTIYGPDVLFLE